VKKKNNPPTKNSVCSNQCLGPHLHHVHHLSSRIPFYRLSDILKDHPELKAVSRIGLWESFKTVRLALWDEANQRLVSFREARAVARNRT
jgi:omega-6 fatty acid desaturase (delta-12 desaturase)